MYPEVARVSCKVCKEFSVNFEKGTVNTYEDGDGNKLPILRLGTPTPCETCPKKSPENEPSLVLTKRSLAAWDFYNRAKATAGMQSALFNCPTTQRNFVLLDNVLERAKSEYSSKTQKARER